MLGEAGRISLRTNGQLVQSEPVTSGCIPK